MSEAAIRYHDIHWRCVPAVHDPHRNLCVVTVCMPHSDPMVFRPLLDYFIAMDHCRSVDWQRRVASAVGCFIDFVIAHAKKPLEQTVLESFAHALCSGTAQAIPELASLGWKPRSHRQAHRIVGAVIDFLDWLGPVPDGVLPSPGGTAFDRIRRARAAEHRSAHALLGHLGTKETATRFAPLLHGAPPPDIVMHSFDEQRFFELCAQFRRRGSRGHVAEKCLQLRDVLILILLHGGGLRSCEPFHLFLGDVGTTPGHPDVAEVRLYHPADGRVVTTALDPRGEGLTRAEYLRKFWDMAPRHRCSGRLHAGWKHLRLSNPRERYTVVRWSSPRWGELFLDLFYQYAAQRPSTRHAYIFVSEEPRVYGEPYTLPAFRKAYAKAIRAMGEVARKDRGTTPHAHRHAYGKRLRTAGLDRTALQSAMNHRSPTAQDVYGQPTAGEIAQAFRDAEMRIREAVAPQEGPLARRRRRNNER